MYHWIFARKFAVFLAGSRKYRGTCHLSVPRSSPFGTKIILGKISSPVQLTATTLTDPDPVSLCQLVLVLIHHSLSLADTTHHPFCLIQLQHKHNISYIIYHTCNRKIMRLLQYLYLASLLFILMVYYHYTILNYLIQPNHHGTAINNNINDREQCLTNLRRYNAAYLRRHIKQFWGR